MTEEQESRSIQWAAGLFEGEGCLTRALNKTRDGWSMKIKMTDLDILESFHQVVGYRGNIGRYSRHPSNKLHHKSHATWETSRSDTIYEIITMIYPFMGERRCNKMDEFKQWYNTKNEVTNS